MLHAISVNLKEHSAFRSSLMAYLSYFHNISEASEAYQYDVSGRVSAGCTVQPLNVKTPHYEDILT